MRRTPLYSAPRRTPPGAAPSSGGFGSVAPTLEPPAPSAAAAAPKSSATPLARRLRARWLDLTLVGITVTALAVAAIRFAPAWQRPLTQKDIDRAVLHALNEHPLPAPAAKAFEAVSGSVVKVLGYAQPEGPAADGDATAGAPGGKAGGKNGSKVEPKTDRVAPEGTDEREERGVGTGVVIVDNGTILTNLHVVFGAKRIKVVFADGLESDADVVGLQPQNDLAVLRARRIPDDLKAATMRSTADLRHGDRVTAIGFPFGIGPSVSHGVVSGLKREFRSSEGQKILTNLIQFDAAANPGNSGGPLVTDSGEVVGIVTAIYNPTRERFFVGIGFAVPIENAAQAAGMPPF